MKVSTRADYTYKHNKIRQRHGWLRLTPAYSVRLVEELVGHLPTNARVLDPFSGTATTGLACAERGLSCELFDINPFLVWFGNLKTSRYTDIEIEEGLRALHEIVEQFKSRRTRGAWLPAIHNIERWWPVDTLQRLGLLRAIVVEKLGEPLLSPGALGIIWVAFARLVIEHSAAAFNHVSVSFKEVAETGKSELISSFLSYGTQFLEDARTELPGNALVHLKDSREAASAGLFDAVITSPPYPNRISYIRELRPYMYWLGFLSTGKMAGDLDWSAIGGTWGSATSRLATWSNEGMALESVENAAAQIEKTKEKNSGLMAQYVRKYFYDMHQHFASLRPILRPEAELHYVIGNSSFYGILVKAEQLMAESLNLLGFTAVTNRIVRKRNSNKELFEFCLSARR